MDEKCISNVYVKSFLKWLRNYDNGAKVLSHYDIRVVENPPHNDSVICMFKDKNTGIVFFLRAGFNMEMKYPNMENDMIISFISLYNMIKLLSTDDRVENILKTMRKKKLYPIISVSFNRTHVSPVVDITFSVGLMFIPDLRKIRVRVDDNVYVMRKKIIPVEYVFKVNITDPDNVLTRKAVSSSKMIVDIELLNKINSNYYSISVSNTHVLSISYADIRSFSYLLSRFFMAIPSTVIIPYVSVDESAFVEASRSLFSFIKAPQGLQRIIFTSIRGGNDVIINGEIVVDTVNRHLCQLKVSNPAGDELFSVYNKCADETAKKIEKLGLNTAV